MKHSHHTGQRFHAKDIYDPTMTCRFVAMEGVSMAEHFNDNHVRFGLDGHRYYDGTRHSNVVGVHGDREVEIAAWVCHIDGCEHEIHGLTQSKWREHFKAHHKGLSFQYWLCQPRLVETGKKGMRTNKRSTRTNRGFLVRRSPGWES